MWKSRQTRFLHPAYRAIYNARKTVPATVQSMPMITAVLKTSRCLFTRNENTAQRQARYA